MSETIQVSVDGKSYPIEMADNADARTFLARLPMTLTFENFGRNERIAYPKPALELEWNWDAGAEFRISIKKPELQGLRP